MKAPALIFCLSLFATTHAMATETPDYKVIAKDGKFEVRDYPAMSVVRTTSGSGDFMRLFRYISGGNEGGQKIAMTAPVLVQHEGEKPGMSFIVPRDVATTKIPAPEDVAVKVDNVASARFAVLRFSGGRNEENEKKALASLRQQMEAKQLEPAGEPVFAYYDPPWIPGFMRRNEAMLRIVGSQP